MKNGFDAQGNPVAAAGQKRPFILDPLLQKLLSVVRHPEVRAKRASKDARLGPSPFEGRFAAASG